MGNLVWFIILLNGFEGMYKELLYDGCGDLVVIGRALVGV